MRVIFALIKTNKRYIRNRDNKAWNKFRLPRDLNPWLLWYTNWADKPTGRDARKFALAKTLLTLDRQTGKSTEEYAVAKALLNLSVEPAMSSGEQIKY